MTVKVSPPSGSACLRFVQRICRDFQKTSGHDAQTIPHLRITSSIPGRIVGSFEVKPINVNRLGTLHGGCIATLTDTLGSLAIASKGLYSTGVSTDLHTTFVKPGGKIGDNLIVLAKLINMGKTFAFTRIEFRHPVTNALLAYGSHTKFIGKATSHPENVKFDETGESVIEGKQPHEWQDHGPM